MRSFGPVIEKTIDGVKHWWCGGRWSPNPRDAWRVVPKDIEVHGDGALVVELVSSEDAEALQARVDQLRAALNSISAFGDGGGIYVQIADEALRADIAATEGAK